MTFYPKLVRDKVPDLIRLEGRAAVVEVLAASELRPALLDKLLEEAAEAAAASQVELPEELADVLEVLRALAGSLGLSLNEVVALADDKRARRGGFDRGLFLVSAEAVGPTPTSPGTDPGRPGLGTIGASSLRAWIH